MPSESQAEARFMAAAAHNPDFAKKAGVPQSVAKEFNEADKGRNLKSLPKKKAAPAAHVFGSLAPGK